MDSATGTALKPTVGSLCALYVHAMYILPSDVSKTWHAEIYFNSLTY